MSERDDLVARLKKGWFTGPEKAAHNAGIDALASALAEAETALAHAREEIRIREESQIPVIPHGAKERMDNLEAALAEAERKQAIDEQQYADLLADYSNLRRERDRLVAVVERMTALLPTLPQYARDVGEAALAVVRPPDPPIDYEQVRRDRLDGGYEDLPPRTAGRRC